MIAVKPVNILLPRDADYTKWAVVACDQFTSQPDYWHKLDEFVGQEKSTLRLIYPEVYLGEENGDERIKTIRDTMSQYMEEGVFEEHKNTFVLIKRTTAFNNTRLGLIVSIDLEDYCFTHPSHAQIRSTEDVVMDRIPPRLKIRRGAPLEFPHIIILLDDEKKSVIEELAAREHSVLYDFDLNMNGGHITGYKVDADEAIALFEQYARTKLANGQDFLFAVGDGNHSLATAQAYWNELKQTLSPEERETHPARFALCEMENLYDEGIKFEPIHRFVFGADESLLAQLDKIGGEGRIKAVLNGRESYFSVPSNCAEAISAVQKVLESYVGSHSGCKVDYIHGEDNLAAVASEHKGVALIMPSLRKDELFSYVATHGALSKKTFSMGEAQEKRYYVEAHKI